MKENHALTVKDPITVTWLNLTMSNQTVKNSLKAKKIELPQMNFVLEKQLINFSSTYQPLSICKNFIKKILELIESQEDVCHFWDQHSSFALNKILLGINHCYSFIHLWPFSLWKILKKSYNGSRIMTMHHFGVQSGPFASNNFFFSENLLMSLVSFIHAYLHAKNQSHILIYQ